MASRRERVVSGTVLTFRVKRAIVTSNAWKTPEQMWKDADPFGDEQVFPASVARLSKNKQQLYVTLPTRFLDNVSDDERVLNVEVNGNLTVGNHGSVVTQLLCALKRQPDATFFHGMEMGLNVTIPAELSGEWNFREDVVDAKAGGETDEETDAEDPDYVVARVLAADERAVDEIERRVHEMANKKRRVDQMLEDQGSRARRRKKTRQDEGPLPANVSDRVHVRNSTMLGAGQGLFANVNFYPGETVVWMGVPTLVDNVFKVAAQANGFPDDSFFHIEKRAGMLKKQSGQLLIMDRNFEHVEEPPLWYFINHGGDTANLRFDYDPQRNEFKWIAKEFIPEGEELFFNYNPGKKTTFYDEEHAPKAEKPRSMTELLATVLPTKEMRDKREEIEEIEEREEMTD